MSELGTDDWTVTGVADVDTLVVDMDIGGGGGGGVDDVAKGLNWGWSFLGGVWICDGSLIFVRKCN